MTSPSVRRVIFAVTLVLSIAGIQLAHALGKLPVFQERVLPAEPSVPGSYAGISVAITPAGKRAVVGVPAQGANHSLVLGSAVVYDSHGTADWTVTARLRNNDPNSQNQGQGVAMSADGNIICTSDFLADNSQGAVYVFHYSGGTWDSGVKLVSSHRLDSTYFGFGFAISLDGNTIGTVQADIGGGAFIFARTKTNSWQQQGPRIDLNLSSSGFQQQSVALSSNGNFLIIGAPYDLVSQGSISFFKRSPSKTWQQSGPKITVVGSNYLGYGLSLSADGSVLLASGYPGCSVFQIDTQAVTYNILQALAVPLSESDFGASVAMSTDAKRIIVGSARVSSNVSLMTATNETYTYFTGGAFIFDRSGDGLTPYEFVGSFSLPPQFYPNPESYYHQNSGFGYAVAVSDENHFVIGAYGSPAGLYTPENTEGIGMVPLCVKLAKDN